MSIFMSPTLFNRRLRLERAQPTTAICRNLSQVVASGSTSRPYAWSRPSFVAQCASPFMRALPLTLAALVIAQGCTSRAASPSRHVVRLAKNTSMSEVLAREYAQAVPHVEFELVDVVGSVSAVDAMQRGQADLGVVFADVAYQAHASLGDRREPSVGDLRGMAALQVAQVHLLA